MSKSLVEMTADIIQSQISTTEMSTTDIQEALYIRKKRPAGKPAKGDCFQNQKKQKNHHIHNQNRYQSILHDRHF